VRFAATRSDAKFCGPTCRQRGKRKRDAPPVTGDRRHQFGPGPTRRGGRRHSTVARDVTAAIIETCADLGEQLRDVHLGALRDEDAPTVEQVDAALAGVQAITAYLRDLRERAAAGASPVAVWDERLKLMVTGTDEAGRPGAYTDRAPANGTMRGGQMFAK
jgi:hypothetical protein